ncbi:MAG TPA: hypothetical protein VKS22_13895 [Candidatus Binataceae bacterium]|nr:hypothetical protein [Candidatus Binataceae bacterium]
MTESQSVGCAFADDGRVDEQLAAEICLLRAERVRLSAELEQAQGFQRIFDACTTAISVHIFPELTYREVNRVMSVVSGYSHAEMIGQTPQALGIWTQTEQIGHFVRGLNEKVTSIVWKPPSVCAGGRSRRWFRASWSSWMGAAVW